MKRMSIATPSLSEYHQAIFDLLPNQGGWSDEEYLWLTDHTSRFIEFTDGYIEPLPMPTDLHQCIGQFMFTSIMTFVMPMGGTVHFGFACVCASASSASQMSCSW